MIRIVFIITFLVGGWVAKYPKAAYKNVSAFSKTEASKGHGVHKELHKIKDIKGE